MGGRGAIAPLNFGRSVYPIPTRGKIIPTTLLLAPPDFQTFLRPCGVRSVNFENFQVFFVPQDLSQNTEVLDRRKIGIKQTAQIQTHIMLLVNKPTLTYLVSLTLRL